MQPRSTNVGDRRTTCCGSGNGHVARCYLAANSVDTSPPRTCRAPRRGHAERMSMRRLVLILVLASTHALRRVATPSARRPWLAVTQDADTALALRALSNAAKDDVRGIARPDAEAPILPACTYWIGAAFRKWLGSTDPIAVGRDPRLSSEDLSMAFCRGAEACDAGPATTPAMLESLLGPSAVYAGSVFVTASHLPPEWNGLKLFSRQLGRGLNKVR